MEKFHISKMLCIETLLTSAASFAGGILVGILGSKLALLFLFKLLHVPAEFGFYVCLNGIGICAAIFGIAFCDFVSEFWHGRYYENEISL